MLVMSSGLGLEAETLTLPRGRGGDPCREALRDQRCNVLEMWSGFS